MPGKVRQSGGLLLENIHFMEENHFDYFIYFYSSCEGSGHRTSNRGNLLSSLFKYFHILRIDMMRKQNLQRAGLFSQTPWLLAGDCFFFLGNVLYLSSVWWDPVVGLSGYTYLLWTVQPSCYKKNNAHFRSYFQLQEKIQCQVFDLDQCHNAIENVTLCKDEDNDTSSLLVVVSFITFIKVLIY